jgi:hypothetical protein
VEAIKQLVGWQLSPTHPLTQWHDAVEIIGTGLFILLIYLPRASEKGQLLIASPSD